MAHNPLYPTKGNPADIRMVIIETANYLSKLELNALLHHLQNSVITREKRNH